MVMMSELEQGWSQERREQWLREHADQPTHLVQFSAMVTVEAVVPPWETPQVAAARSAVHWGDACMRAIRDKETRLHARAVHIEQVSHTISAAALAQQNNRLRQL